MGDAVAIELLQPLNLTGGAVFTNGLTKSFDYGEYLRIWGDAIRRLDGWQERLMVGFRAALFLDGVGIGLLAALQAVAQSSDRSSACSSTVCVAFSCLSGG